MFDVEQILLTNPDDPKIREVTTRMSRFVCNLETKEECFKEKAYIVETDIPIVFSRYTPDKVTSEKNVYLITKLEKSGSRIFLAPGTIAFIMFIRTEAMDIFSVKDIELFSLKFFTKHIKNSYTDGNDILINGKKVMGFTLVYNNVLNTLMIRFILTLKSKVLNDFIQDEDFKDRKYKEITGVCDETELSENDVREIINRFIDIVLSWRKTNGE